MFSSSLAGSNSGSSGTGVRAGEMEAGLTVLGVELDLLTSSSIRSILAWEGWRRPSISWEGKRGCDRVMELLLGAAAPPRSGLTFFSSCCNMALAL